MSTTHSHLMKVTRRGRPFVKDIQDLFCTLLISLHLDNHRSFFKSYPNSFNTDEAAANLASLKFSQSHRAADPKDPARIITTTTTTTFSMTRDMARGICQHFMDAHLIENVADLDSVTFKERGIYMCTPKGLHMLERFITKNGISATHIGHIFAEQPIYMKMLHLERRGHDDEIIVTRGVIEVVWRRLIGREPNLTTLSDDDLATSLHHRWYNKLPNGVGPVNPEEGLIVRKVPKEDKKGDEYQFPGLALTTWLCDFTTCTGIDEAAELAGHLVRYGLISLVHDRGRIKESNLVVTVKAGGAGGAAGAMMQEAEFRATDKSIYRVTKEGMQIARWIDSPTAISASSTTNVTKSDTNSSTNNGVSKPNLHAQSSLSSLARTSQSTDETLHPSNNSNPDETHAKDSHTTRLRQILEEPAVRSLFREFLRANFCEENLSFWLDVQDFKRKFGTTSSAVAMPGSKARSQGHQAMEKHQQDLIAMAFVIYNTYLAPASPCELNIDHNLRAELISHMNHITSLTESEASKKDANPSLHASQVQTTIKLYERIQAYIFRLMATDSVPRFLKTDKFVALMRTLYNSDTFVDPDELAAKANGLSISSGGIEDDIPTRAYLTISQAANEKLAMKSGFT